MIVKSLSVILWVVAWQAWLPVSTVSAQDHAMLNPPAVGPPAAHSEQQMAVDDYRIDIQDGVTVDSYNLELLAKHDAARTQSMIDGFSGRSPKRSTTAVDKDSGGQATGWLPRPATAALWLAGLMAVVLMALRYRR
jgi:hypothetical protein